MDRIATFEKVSFEQFLADCKESDFWFGNVETVRKRWEAIKLPARSTSGSAGYDFYMPFGFAQIGIRPITIPTGIRCNMKEGWSLWILPRSGYGFKYGMRLGNTVGIIDSDYYHAKNEGHIMARVTADTMFRIEQGERFIQGIFLPFGITISDSCDGVREGGMGSTGS